MIFVRVGLQALLRLRTDLYAYLHLLPPQVSMISGGARTRRFLGGVRSAIDPVGVCERDVYLFKTLTIGLVSTFAVICASRLVQLALLSRWR